MRHLIAGHTTNRDRIPYERALDFANKEKITELLYPLFVHNIGALLYHPTNQNRTSQVMAAAERRKQEQQGQSLRTSPGGLPSISHPQPQQPHSMGLPSHQPSLPSNNVPRPSLDRAHTFPTPPTSASGGMSNMGSSESFNWQGQSMNGSQGPNGMSSMDPASRSMPNTPATTPPTISYQGSAAQQPYDSHRPMYSTQSSQHPPYPATNGSHDRLYSHANAYPKSEMGPPSSRPTGPGAPGDHHDTKPPNGVLPSDQGSQPHAGDEDGDREHEGEYTHDSGAYDGGRPSYNYTAPGVGALTNEANINPEMTGSPNHHPGSGRATPRSAAPPQPYYSHNGGYGTPPGVQQQSSNVYSVMSNDRPPTNGSSGGEVYTTQADMTNSMSNGYAPQPPMLNGSVGIKRGRDDDEGLGRSDGPGMGIDLKRRKTMESSVSAPAYDALSRPTSAISGGPQAR